MTRFYRWHARSCQNVWYPTQLIFHFKSSNRNMAFGLVYYRSYSWWTLQTTNRFIYSNLESSLERILGIRSIGVGDVKFFEIFWKKNPRNNEYLFLVITSIKFHCNSIENYLSQIIFHPTSIWVAKWSSAAYQIGDQNFLPGHFHPYVPPRFFPPESSPLVLFPPEGSPPRAFSTRKFPLELFTPGSFPP